MEWLKKGAITFSLAFNKVEKDSFAQNESEEILRGNVGTVNPYVANQLMQDLKNGNLTREVKQFRKKYYEILRESAKYKFKNGELLSEEEARKMKLTQGDPYDNYPVEIVFDNKSLGMGLVESKEVRPLKIVRGVVPRHRLESYTAILHVRDINGQHKLLDFYVPKNLENHLILNELETLKVTKKLTEMVNFLETSFTTQDSEMLRFSYKILAFDKVVEHNNNYIVKMFAEVVEDGRWIAQKFMVID